MVDGFPRQKQQTPTRKQENMQHKKTRVRNTSRPRASAMVAAPERRRSWAFFDFS